MEDKKTQVKTAPHSKESEMMVLGCMLTSVNSLNIAADGLDDNDFYFTEHRIIFQCLKEAFKKNKPADIHIIAEDLKRIDQLEDTGGVAYLTTLAQYAGTSAYIDEYVSLVKNKAILRKMISAAQEVEKQALEEPSDVSSALDEAQAKFFYISQFANHADGILLKDIISGIKSTTQTPYLKEVQQRQEEYRTKGPNQSKITGTASHFNDLDKTINGMNDSNLMILAARPAMGKTAFALNICENICFKNNMPVGIFSLEMTAQQLMHRIICSQSEVESEKILTGALDGLEYQRIVAAVNMMMKSQMVIDDQPGLKITDLRARARRMKEAYNIGFLMIDYLQLLSGSGNMRSLENRQVEISEISRMLKTLARELNIPVMCLSQLSRKVEERQGHRPMLSDLRESGCLAAETEIKDANTGKIYTIKELAESKNVLPITVLGLDKDLKLTKHKMTKAFYSGKKQVYELKTRAGYSIKASANHPFYKLEGWTRLDHLKPGDKIAIPRSTGCELAHSKMKDEEIILLAHLIGDGCVLPNQPYHYTSADLQNIDTVNQTSKHLFNINGRIVQQRNWYHIYLPSPVHPTHNTYHPITSWYNELGLQRTHSYHKQLPQALFECPPIKQALFLKHLWATDGSLSEKNIKNRSPSASIYYATSSPVLSKQVQHLLLNIGIHSTCSIVPSSKGYRSMYHVQIQGKSNQTKFLSMVGWAGQRGEKIPHLLNNLEKIHSNPNNDIIPKQAWTSVVKAAKEKNNISWRYICEKLEMSYCGTTLYKSGISRKKMKKLAEILNSNALTQLAESDLYWDDIVSITPKEVEDVYDATVEDVHNFLANNIIVHNSLEQDSDLVMFLLRREYYDPYDKPGQAELIIAKNRHGPVGSVPLTYRKEIIQFANYAGAQEEENPVYAE